MKKIVVLFLMASVMMLSIFGALSASADTGAGSYEIAEGDQLGLWFARPHLDGDEWVVDSEENVYAAVTFTAEKPFSNIVFPYWAGNPEAFKGIHAGEIELAIFKAVDGNYGDDYDSENAYRREVITVNKDLPTGYTWTVEQVPVGRWCFRVTLLTDEQAYFVLAEAEPVDDDAEFDISTIMMQNQGKEGFNVTIYYDDVVINTPLPTDEPEPTAEPGDDPTAEPGEEPTAEPGDDPTDEPGEDSTAKAVIEDPTLVPVDEDPTAEPPAKKGCGGSVAGGFALLAAAGAVLFLRKRR